MTWSPGVTCPSCHGQGYFYIEACPALWIEDEMVFPENGDMCMICEDCERTGIVTAVYAAGLRARVDQIMMRAMLEHDPQASHRLAVEAENLDRLLEA